ncbi:uncharacterized protein LOC141853839 [Brevipalpus obovatus]|uniref:uncharacterized protein LOC141853839 n=1 Tax=Brevipalpus obovatus TaxID=246614 RepID=UPI003D9EADA6
MSQSITMHRNRNHFSLIVVAIISTCVTIVVSATNGEKTSSSVSPIPDPQIPREAEYLIEPGESFPSVLDSSVSLDEPSLSTFKRNLWAAQLFSGQNSIPIGKPVMIESVPGPSTRTSMKLNDRTYLPSFFAYGGYSAPLRVSLNRLKSSNQVNSGSSQRMYRVKL